MTSVGGGCSCGKHRFCCLGLPQTVFACHCRECQKMSGSAFLVWLEFRQEQVDLDLSRMKQYSRKGESGNRVNLYFCIDCGNSFYGTIEGRPGVFLTSGTFETTDWIKPMAHLWTDSAEHWLKSPDGGLNVF